ncbi:HD domain-containing protein [Oxyplasma meridianum]|uniref:HD domain-containing protein n=1 Tax=Oxyplasma meridianum TaxID=3073602 RepID=A0AAX4NHZ6_9ARCH
MEKFKVIQDPLNGPIKVDKLALELMDSTYFQRLRYVRQLGLCYLVFPGANHTRFEHSLGAYHLASEASEAFGIRDRDIFQVSALLHDIGHPAMSHSVESYFEKLTGMDHLEASCKIIQGKEPFGDSQIPEILEKFSISPSEVASIISGKSSTYPVISKLISGPTDIDEMDYLRRDALFTGVAMGHIDHRRIFNVTSIDDNSLYIEEKGIPAAESLLIGRILMYNSVYFHKTARIAQLMLEKALEISGGELGNPFRITDHYLMDKLLTNKKAGYISKSIMERRLYKPVLKTSYSREKLSSIKQGIGELGLDVTEKTITDIIPPLDFIGEGRIKSSIQVLVGGRKVDIKELSPLVAALYGTMKKRHILVSADVSVKSRVEKTLGNI